MQKIRYLWKKLTIIKFLTIRIKDVEHILKQWKDFSAV